METNLTQTRPIRGVYRVVLKVKHQIKIMIVRPVVAILHMLTMLISLVCHTAQLAMRQMWQKTVTGAGEPNPSPVRIS